MNEKIMQAIEGMAKALDSDCYSIKISLLESGIIDNKLANKLSAEIFEESK